MNDNTQNLENFEGWEETTDVDFFNQEQVEQTSEEETLENIEETAEETSKENEEKQEDKEPDFFSEEEITNSNEEETEEEEETTETKSSNVSTLNFLSEKGFIEYELEEGEELTEELAEEIIEDKFDEAVDNKVKDLLEDLPEAGKQFIQFALKGGDLNQYVNLISKSSNKLTEDIDLEEESNQELVVREILKSNGEDEETIDAQIEFLKESDKLKMFSEKKFNKWKSDNKKVKENLLKEQSDRIKQQKEQIKQAKKETLAFIDKNEEVGGLKFSKNDKKTIASYINDRTIKLQNGSTISKLQKELFYDLPQNKQAYMQLAMLMNNRNEDGTFNFESIAKNTKTKVVKEVKENVRRSKSSIPTKSINSKKDSKKSLADFFDN